MHWHAHTLSALISLQTLLDALRILGYPAVALFIMVESTGIPFPGETMLLLASFFAATHPELQLQLPIIIACAAAGAILGDNFGYIIGRTGGRALVERFGKYIFVKPHHLDYAEKFFTKHGSKTVFFGRFFSILRTWSAFLAGVNHMHWRSFLIYNAAGGIVWAVIYGLLGFYAGRLFSNNFDRVASLASTISWIGAGLIAAVAVALYIFFRMRRRRKLVASAGSASTQDSSPEPAGEHPEHPEHSEHLESTEEVKR